MKRCRYTFQCKRNQFIDSKKYMQQLFAPAYGIYRSVLALDYNTLSLMYEQHEKDTWDISLAEYSVYTLLWSKPLWKRVVRNHILGIFHSKNMAEDAWLEALNAGTILMSICWYLDCNSIKMLGRVCKPLQKKYDNVLINLLDTDNTYNARKQQSTFIKLVS